MDALVVFVLVVVAIGCLLALGYVVAPIYEKRKELREVLRRKDDNTSR